MEERKPIRMENREIEIETPLGPSEQEQIKFVRSALVEVADTAARYSVSPTPTSLLEAGTASSDQEIAQVLSEVVIEDPYFGKISLSEAEGVSDASIITLAKAKAVESETRNPEVKTKFQDFSDRLALELGSLLAKTGGKKALAAAGAVALLATACSTDAGAYSPETPLPLPTETSAPTQIAPSPTPEPENVAPENVIDTSQFEAKWVTEGYVEDLRYGGTFTTKEHEVGGETREFVVFRVGFSEIWFDKSLSEDLNGKILIPNPSFSEDSLDHIQRWGALVHALNIGRVISKSQYNYDPEWFSKYIKDLSEHLGETYSFKAYRRVGESNEQYEMGVVDPTKPVRFFILPPAMDFETAMATPGGESAPWQLQLNVGGGMFQGAKISPEGALDIYQTDSQYQAEQILAEPEFWGAYAAGNVVYFGAISSRIDRIFGKIDTIDAYGSKAFDSDFFTDGKFDLSKSFLVLATPTPQ
jgi:hypothetical protein